MPICIRKDHDTGMIARKTQNYRRAGLIRSLQRPRCCTVLMNSAILAKQNSLLRGANYIGTLVGTRFDVY